jgi:predicted HNH restriction endonuclease
MNSNRRFKMIKYKNLWEGKVIEISADEFNDRLINLDDHYEKLLKSIFIEYEVEAFSKSNDVIYFNLSDKNKNLFRFAFTNLKNSGDKKPNQNNKRFYIHKNIPNYKEDSLYFLIGLYNAGDKVIHTISEASEFVGNYLKTTIESNRGNYSSFWIRFEQIIDHYESNKDHSIKEKTAKAREHVYNVMYLTKLIKFEDILRNLELNSSEKKLIKLTDEVYATEKLLLVRNGKLKDQALNNANYTCENCGKKETFYTKDGRMYFEAHHIIPFNISNHLEFNSSLDCIENISCLCPECHRKIHYAIAKERNNILKKIIKKELLIKFKISEDYIDKISKYYNGEDGQTDE